MLMLREQISPFDVNFVRKEEILDFTSLKGGVIRLFSSLRIYECIFVLHHFKILILLQYSKFLNFLTFFYVSFSFI